MELLAPSKPNLLLSRLEQLSGPLRRLLPVRMHPLLSPLKLRSLRWMRSNIPLHNNLGGRRKREINQRKTITMNNQKINHKPLLPGNNHNRNQNSRVSFVVTITTSETVHIAMKWPIFLREIHNLLCLLSLSHNNNLWLLKPPLQGVVPINPMMRPRQVPTFTCLTGLI
jgi:hypothetical protein